jgi:hypothetical protein
MSGKGFSRRSVAIGGGIALTLGLGALGVSLPRWLHRYRPSPYDDLLGQLVNRDAAATVGTAALAGDALSGVGGLGNNASAAHLATELRHRLERRSLAEVTDSDLAQGKLSEVKGWVLPETLVVLGALAAAEAT